MINSNNDHKNIVLQKRRNIIFLIYRYLVLNIPKFKQKQELLDNSQVVLSDAVINEYEYLFDVWDDIKKNIINLLNKKWSWDRLNNLHKAVLINGAYEIIYLKKDKGLVIDQSIIFIKKYDPDLKYHYINAILDKL